MDVRVARQKTSLRARIIKIPGELGEPKGLGNKEGKKPTRCQKNGLHGMDHLVYKKVLTGEKGKRVC